MNVNRILHLMIPSWRQNIIFMKIYYKKCQTSIFLENVNNTKNNYHYINKYETSILL